MENWIHWDETFTEPIIEYKSKNYRRKFICEVNGKRFCAFRKRALLSF